MGLSDEGLILVVTLTWVPLLVAHFFIVKRAIRIVSANAISEYNRNLVAMVAFLLILSLYMVVCTVTMYAAMHDRETSRPYITLSAEVVWLFSPMIATASILKVNRSIYPGCFRVVPLNKTQWKLCMKRAILFGIPLCCVFAVGDQIIRQIVSVAITGDPSNPVPIDRTFLDSVGEVFGYTGENGWISGLIGYVSNLTIGPIINLFAPQSDSVVEYNNAAQTGVALYILYAVPEEIGWTGTLYPMLLNHFTPSARDPARLMTSNRFTVLKASVLTGVVWGLWHCPFVILKWNPAIDTLTGFVYNALFMLSCIAARCVLISLVWPVHATPASTSHLLDTSVDNDSTGLRSPSILPAIFAHASMNSWWAFYTSLFEWSETPGWSILTGSEFSLLAVSWQFLIAFLIIRQSFRKRESPRVANS